MTGKLIALVDASAHARSVCDHAAWAAARTAGTVEILHVLGRREAPERTDLSGAIALGARTSLLQELAELDMRRARLAMARGRAILDDAEAIVAAAGVPVTARLRRGDLVEALAEREADAGMILIGRRGEAADYAPGHLGSNLERVARAARRPVLVASEAFRPIGRVLVAHDGGPGGARVVDHVAGSPLYRGLAVTVATAGTATPAVAQALEAAQARLAAAGIAAETRIAPGEPEAALAELATAGGFDLAVLGAQGAARVRSLMLGSTTTELVHALAIPVVLVRGA